jgi:hypothetical protein
MSGVFNERPPRRDALTLWDPLKVFSVFQHWPVDLPLSSLMRKGAFLMAIATAKRAHELASLLSDATHFRWEGDVIRFTPTRFTKTDRPGHLCPPFIRQAMERGFEHLPSGDCETHSAREGPFVFTA